MGFQLDSGGFYVYFNNFSDRLTGQGFLPPELADKLYKAQQAAIDKAASESYCRASSLKHGDREIYCDRVKNHLGDHSWAHLTQHDLDIARVEAQMEATKALRKTFPKKNARANDLSKMTLAEVDALITWCTAELARLKEGHSNE